MNETGKKLETVNEILSSNVDVETVQTEKLPIRRDGVEILTILNTVAEINYASNKTAFDGSASFFFWGQTKWLQEI